MTLFFCLFVFLLLKKSVFTLLLWELDESNEAKIVIFWVFVSNNEKMYFKYNKHIKCSSISGPAGCHPVLLCQ